MFVGLVFVFAVAAGLSPERTGVMLVAIVVTLLAYLLFEMSGRRGDAQIASESGPTLPLTDRY